MKSIFILLFSCVLWTSGASAQSVSLGWAGKMGGASLDAGNAIATDQSGNVYVTGTFMGTNVNFDPNGSSLLSATGGADVFVAKLTSAGALVWVKKMGGSGADAGNAIGVAANGDVYVAGTFVGTANFNTTGGTTELVAAGTGTGQDVFICKLDAAGTLQWAKRAGGTGLDALWDLCVSPASGSVYITGSYSATTTVIDFGATTLTNAGGTDVFVSKLDRNGNFIWAKGLGGTSADIGYGIAVHPASGSLLLTGSFFGAVTFAAGHSLTAAPGGSDVFVHKSDTNGNITWVKQLGGKSTDQPRDIAVDGSGNVYTVGYFTDSANMDPGGTHMVYGHPGYQDVFVSKLTAAGAFSYARAIGGPLSATIPSEEPSKFFGEALVADASGNVFVTGRIDDAIVDIVPGNDIFYLRSKGGSDIFVVAYKPSGDLAWARTFGGTGDDRGMGIDLDASGNIYVTGAFLSQVNFNPNHRGTPVNLTAAVSDIFVQRLNPFTCTPTITPLVTTNACDSFRYDGKLYTSSSVFSTLWVNAAGCDSMVTVDLTVRRSSTPVLYTPPSHCDSFDFHGVVYRETGFYDQVIPNSVGCDSLVTIDLTIVKSSWDTIYRVTDCAGYLFDTVTYYTTGFHVHIYPHSNGCDSNVVLGLTVDTVNVAVTADAEKITAAEAGAVWQWLDCDDGYAAITGADSQQFTPVRTGRYAVAVTVNGCTDTSACVSFTIPESIHEAGNMPEWRIYPNPADAGLYVNTTVAGRLTLTGMDGRIVTEEILQQGVNRIDISTAAPGVYLARVADAAGNILGVRKFVKTGKY